MTGAQGPADSSGILAWFAGNSVAANLLMVSLIIGGVFGLMGMRTEVFPPIDPRTITVSVTYAGANPEEVETAINARLESALSGISGIQSIQSDASEGSGTLTANLTSFANADDVLTEVEDAVVAISDFPPEGAEDPLIEKSKLEPQILTLALYGQGGRARLREVANDLRLGLLGTNQLANVTLAGTLGYELTIEVSEETLQTYDLTIETISQKITAASVDLAGGTLATSGGDILLRTPARRTSAQEFGNIPILVAADGSVVRLSDVALIRDGFADGDLQNLYQGEPAVFLTVYRNAEQGVIEAEAVVQAYLETVRLPAGLNLEIRDNETNSLRDRINLMLRSAIVGFGLVFLVLVLFLDLKLAFWTSLAIPISFLGGLAIASFLGASLNMVSLFALILVLGIVVDDAVVIGENIFDAQSRGGDRAAAALTGLREVAKPVTLGVTTTIIAFAPLAFTTGTIGQIVAVVPVVVIAILAISLLEGLVILPAHLSHGGTWSVGALKQVQRLFSGALLATVRFIVRPLVWVSATFRYAALGVIFSATGLTLYAFTSGFLDFVFLPPTESDRVEVTLTMAEGAPYWETEAAAQSLIAAAERVRTRLISEDGTDPILTTSATIGQTTASGGGPGSSSLATQSNKAQVRVDLVPSDLRAISSSEFEQIWRAETGSIAGADKISFNSSLFSLGNDISLDLSHRDPDQLLQASDALRAILSASEGVYDLQSSLQFGKRQLEFVLKDRGMALGISEGDLARQIRRAFFGETVQTLQRGLDEVPVVVRYPREARANLSDVYTMSIQIPGGERVPITEVADILESQSLSTIERTDGRRVISLTGKVDSTVTTADIINSSLMEDHLPALEAKFDGLIWSLGDDAAGQSRDLQNIFFAFVVAMLGIFLLLASFTRSYLLPLIILSTVIYGVVGAILGHIALGYPLTFVSIFGIVALAGVVINDTILLLDDYLRRIARNPSMAKVEALVESAARRFRPILMTTLSTSLGLLPMIFETSLQAKFLIPMAISLGFGILVATPILLLAIPATVLVLDDLGRPFRWAKLRFRSLAADPANTQGAPTA